MFARVARFLLLLSIGFVALSTSPSGAVAATGHPVPTHHCGQLHTRGFPGVAAIRSERTSCREARGVARWIYRELHRASFNGESFGLPPKVGPVHRRTFRCRYHEVSDHYGFIYYAARCHAGHAVVRLHLSS